MKRILAFLCVLAMMLSIVPAAAFAATQDVQAIIDAGAEEIIVLEADASNITVSRDTTIDLNGHDLDGVTVTGGTLYCLDSQTADYTVADGIYGHVTNVTGNVKAAEGYLQVGDSFHAVNLDIYAMTLRAADVGVYYKSNFAADEIVAAQVESFGVALSVVTAPNADNLDSYCGYSAFTGFEAGEGANSVGTSTLLKGIMKPANGDNRNAKNAAMPVYGRAYIKTAEGYFFGETVKRSLQEQVEAIDGIWAGLKDTQKAPVLSMLEGFTSVMEGWNIPNILGGEAGEGAGEIEIDVPVTAENGVVTEATTVEQGAISITVPAGTKLAEGVNKLTLTVTPKEVSDAGLTLEESQVLMPMDVHVDGLAADNAEPLTIYLGKVMAENLNMGNYTVYHVENGNANEMTLIPVDAEFTAHNQYKYSLDGELTLYMASFSEVAVVSEEAKWEGNRDYSWYDADAETLYIRNADQLAGFGAIVGGMANQKIDPDLAADIAQDSFEGKTVILLADISIGDLNSENGYVFYPIGYYNDHGSYQRVSGVEVTAWIKPFYGTFDGNGNTISNFYQNTWEMFGDYNDGYPALSNYYREGMGLFGRVYGGTVKNLIVDNFSCDSEHGTSGTIAAYADCGATFENISIFNCNPRVYNIANGGIVGCVGWYAKETAENKVTFKNITVDNSNTIAALWDATGTSAGGILGQYYPTSGQSSANYPQNPGVHFEDCRISAAIEVNNDCCSNYHYYWYRYAGMLMGSVRANKTEGGYTMADTTGITAVGCEVNYGYWNEYWYCELVKNTIASYTHDHQFGRLTSITSLSQIQDESGNWNVEGNFALLNEKRECVDCYHIFKNSEGNLYRHFHDVADETNPNIYESFDLNGDGQLNDLKEDRQRYYIPFGQILTGDGMGILANYEFAGVTVTQSGGTLVSQQKFDAPESFVAVNGELKLSEIFTAKTGVTISESAVHAYISPVGDNSTVKPAACVITDGDWENGTLTIEGTGKAKITITDYWYCVPTVVDVIVKEDYTGDYYIAAYKDADSTYYYMTSDLGSATVKRYQAVNAGEKLPASIVAAENSKIFTISKNADGEYIICAYGNENGYLAWTVTNENSGALVAQEAAQPVTITPSDLGRVQIQLQSNSERYLSLNNDYDYFAWYKNTQKYNLILIPVEEMGTCLHENTYSADNAQAATCTEKGKEADTICSDCGMTVVTGAITDKLPHTEVAIGEASAATCTTNGITAGVKCSVCQAIITAQKEIPATGHSYESEVTTEPGCETTGVKTYTCENCDDSYTEEIAAIGHDYNDEGVCGNCGEENPDATVEYTVTFMIGGNVFQTLTQKKNTTIDLSAVVATEMEGYTFVGWTADKVEKGENSTASTFYTVEADDTLYALYSYKEGEGDGGYVLVKDAAELAVGSKIVIVANGTSYALSTTQNENNRGVANVEITDDTITFGDDVQILTLQEGTVDGTYALYTGSGYLYAASSVKNYLRTQTTNNVNGSWTITINSNGVASVVATGSTNRNVMQYNPNTGNNNPLFACYTSASQTALKIYMETSGATTYYTTAVCAHANTTETIVNATCTEAGSTIVTCDDCDKVISENVLPALEHSYDAGVVTTEATCTENGVKTYTCTRENCGATKTETIEAVGHNYVDGICSVCGDKESVSETTISFENTTQRISLSTSKQIWSNGGVTLTNNKSAAQSNVADYTNPIRFYAGSNLVVEATGITKIVFDCNSSSYATALKNSIGTVANVTVTVSSDKVTVEFASPVDSFTIAKLTAKVFVDSVTVTFAK